MERYFAAKEELFRRHLKKGGVAVIVVDAVDGQQPAWGERLDGIFTAAQLVDPLRFFGRIRGACR
jgi:UDP-N-acetylmuramyl tripeptide synthase